ncbi:hypothetical protein AVEN_96464-1 [Araneus ventricosus]|uniref:Uncharacterized protein n=1 Tax=Araneus ventricosus TaxID=182803 RepID=A0A4Y2PCF4_ARAVE|nr:hypothetical protein AVEN_96464-1 [Araneus ventricosus]
MNWTLPSLLVIFPTTPPPAIPSLKAHGYGLWLSRLIGSPYRAYLLSDLRTSPPLKGSQPPQTGLRRRHGEIFSPPGTASLGMRE